MSKRFSIGSVFLFGLYCIGAYGTPVSSLQCANPGSTSTSSSSTSVQANSCTDFSYLFPNTQPASGLNNWQYGYYIGGNGPSLSLNPATYGLLSPTPAYDSTGSLMPGVNAGWWSKNFYLYWTALDAFEGHPNANYTDLHQSPYCDNSLYQNCGNGYDPRGNTSPGSGDLFPTRRYIVPAYSGSTTVTVSGEKDYRTLAGAAQGVTDYIVLVHGANSTVLGCINVPGNAVQWATSVVPTCTPTTSTLDPIGSQPVYTTSVSTMVVPGDFLDIVMVPLYQNNIAAASAGTPGFADFSSGSFQLVTIAGVPEPATFGLMGGALLLFGFARRKLNCSRKS